MPDRARRGTNSIECTQSSKLVVTLRALHSGSVGAVRGKDRGQRVSWEAVTINLGVQLKMTSTGDHWQAVESTRLMLDRLLSMVEKASPSLGVVGSGIFLPICCGSVQGCASHWPDPFPFLVIFPVMVNAQSSYMQS